MKPSMTRRSFIATSSLVIAGAAVSSNIDIFNVSPAQAQPNPTFKPHAFLEIGTDDTITVWVGQTNLGQGSHTGIPMVIADELDGDWQTVQVKMAPAGEPFKSPIWHMQATGGSTSIRHRWDMLRTVGAAARQMLVEAAAQQWEVSPAQCTVEAGTVLGPAGQSARFGQLVARASTLPVPENPPLKNPKEYKIIGSARDRLDIPDKVMGKTVYGIDFSVPDMCIAMVARPPVYGATLQSYNKEAALAVQGVVDVVELEGRVGVCAETTYGAMKGRDALNIQWSAPSHPELSDETLPAIFSDYLEKPGVIAQDEGDVTGSLAQATTTISQGYQLPYLSHAQVEPLNCTAQVEQDRCRIWMPTQGQTATQMTAAQLTGLAPEQVEVMTLPAGGGFGLRGEQDTVFDAVQLSQALKRPVKVVWSREDDFTNDYFRPASHCTIAAGLNGDGTVAAWSHKIAAPSVMTRVLPQFVKNGVDPDAVSGVWDMPYLFANRKVEYVMVELPIPVGFWRSVGYSVNVFAVESFMDELAHAAGADPLAFRLNHLEQGGRMHALLTALADQADWAAPAPAGRAKGVAVTACFESFAAHVAEVSVSERGRITVHKMHCAIDCGTAVYPDAVKAQAEAGVIMAMSTAFHEKVSFAGGGVSSTNYDSYPLLTMSEVPEIEVYIAQNDLKAGGVGEPVFPSVAPAIANAVFAATGVRLRQLPLVMPS
jgi:isoquinoline 1-oxidoreductase beta subunit